MTECIKAEKWRLLVQRRTNIPLWEVQLIRQEKVTWTTAVEELPCQDEEHSLDAVGTREPWSIQSEGISWWK